MRKARWQSLLHGLIVVGIGVLLVNFAKAAPQGSTYHLAKKVTLGGEGAWDYLYADPTTHRVFISRGSHTMVVDADGKLLGDIPKTDGVHGIAIANEFNRGFTSNGRANSVTIFDLKTLETVSELKIMGDNPDTIIYDPASKRVFTFNGRSSDSTAIDAKTGMIVGTVKLAGKLETAQADGAGHMYVNVEDKNQMMAFDTKTLMVTDTWAMAPCDSPSGLAIDAAHHRLFAGCHNKMMAIMDTVSGKVVATPPICNGVDADGFDPGTGYAFASCGDGTITVIHEDSPDKFTVADTIQTQNGARTMAIDTKSHTIYTVTADFGPAPAPTAENPRPRPAMLPNTFSLLIFTLASNNASLTPATAGMPAVAVSFAAKPAPGGAQAASGKDPLVAKGRMLFVSYGCTECHGQNGEGSDEAPDLRTTRLSGDEIAKFLNKPDADATSKGMPSVAPDSPDLQPLVAYVLSIKGTAPKQ